MLDIISKSEGFLDNNPDLAVNNMRQNIIKQCNW